MQLRVSPRTIATMMSKISASTSTDDQAAPESKGVLAATPATTGAADGAWMLLAHGGLLLVVGVAGGALLVWWALAFHQSNEQLWMVPVGLVLLGTPIFAWLSVIASAGACGSFLLRRLLLTSTAPPLVSDPECGEMVNKENI